MLIDSIVIIARILQQRKSRILLGIVGTLLGRWVCEYKYMYHIHPTEIVALTVADGYPIPGHF
jgi:uncharacterized membrane protein YeaQ/YmgE (transglycosylase-associated protein family)